MTELCQRVAQSPNKLDDSGVRMLYGPAECKMDLFRDVVNEISDYLQKTALYLMVNILPPGVVVPVHTDTLPVPIQRWHLPIKTNYQAYFWDTENKYRHFAIGQWQRIYPEKPHSICNLGRTERIHIVVDLEP